MIAMAHFRVYIVLNLVGVFKIFHLHSLASSPTHCRLQIWSYMWPYRKWIYKKGKVFLERRTVATLYKRIYMKVIWMNQLMNTHLAIQSYRFSRVSEIYIHRWAWLLYLYKLQITSNWVQLPPYFVAVQGCGWTVPDLLHFAFWHVLSVLPLSPCIFRLMFCKVMPWHGTFLLQFILMASLVMVVPLMFLKTTLLTCTADFCSPHGLALSQ